MSILDKLILLTIVVAMVAVWGLWRFARHLFPSASRLRIAAMLVVVILATGLVVWATDTPQEQPTVVHLIGYPADADAFHSRFPELTIVQPDAPPTLVALEDFLEASEDTNGQDDFVVSYVTVPGPPITASQ